MAKQDIPAPQAVLPGLGLQGRSVLVTGAAGGIGTAVVQGFSALDAELIAVDRGPPPPGQPPGIEWHACDVAAPGAFQQLASASSRLAAGLDFLVLGSGIFPEAPISDMSQEEWRRVHAVNLDSAFFALQALAPLLRDGGAVVALTSIAAHRGSFRHAHYASSKAGLAALVKSAAHELAPRGIRANCISPGPVDTPMVRPLMQAQGENILRNTPLGRIASPLDVAHAVLFLCSDWSTFITGQVLHVNGGQYIPA